MRLGIIQGNYVPWRGYFDFIHRCDRFILLDDVQYTTRDWRNRNKIRTGDNSTEWLTVPVQGGPRDRLTQEVLIDHSRGWEREHLESFALHLGLAPYAPDAFRLLQNALTVKRRRLSMLNKELLTSICRYLGIGTPIYFNTSGAGLTKTEKLIAICKANGADVYLSGPAARAYLDERAMNDAGIRVEWMDYAGYPDYPQQYPGFDGAVSILDLIANVGRAAPDYIWGWRA